MPQKRCHILSKPIISSHCIISSAIMLVHACMQYLKICQISYDIIPWMSYHSIIPLQCVGTSSISSFNINEIFNHRITTHHLQTSKKSTSFWIWVPQQRDANTSQTRSAFSNMGVSFKWWYPQNTPKWSFLVGKPMVVGYHHFGKPPYVFCQRKNAVEKHPRLGGQT